MEDVIREARQAATSMREQHPSSHPRHEMWFALADFIDDQVRFFGKALPAKVLNVVRAYNAAIDRPDLDGSVG